jgi:hypothetical protein
LIIDPVKAKRYEIRNEDQGSTGGIWSINLNIGLNLPRRASSDPNPLIVQWDATERDANGSLGL